MTRKFDELRKKMSPEAQERARIRGEVMLAGVRLKELRKQLEITQQELAEALQRTQASISQMEQRDDMKLSTLIEYIEATGGELVMTARYPDDVEIPLAPLAAAGG